MTTGLFDISDLWRPTPGAALPAGPALRAIAERLGHTWGETALVRRARIRYTTRLRTTLGRAILEDDCVDLNASLLLNHPEHLAPTLAHELAHLVVFRRYGRVAPHGPHFKALMRVVGLPAAATHDLPVGHLRRRRRRYLYLHTCTRCGQTFIARRVYRGYYCTDCGPRSGWTVFRVPDTPQGRKLLAGAGA